MKLANPVIMRAIVFGAIAVLYLISLPALLSSCASKRTVEKSQSKGDEEARIVRNQYREIVIHERMEFGGRR